MLDTDIKHTAMGVEDLPIKNSLVASPLGGAATSFRSWLSLKSLPLQNPEKAAMIANAIIAGRLISRIPDAGSSFLDIGAHIGSIFSEVHNAEKSIEVFAIEADIYKADNLSKKFPYCTVKSCAVGSVHGKAKFFLNDQSGYNSLVGGANAVSSVVEVEVCTLDEIFPETIFDTIKIDIEGAELGALQGGIELLKRSRSTIMFESTNIEENSLGYSAEKIWKWLTDEGFYIFTPDRLGHDAPPLALESFLDAHQYPIRTHNFFAVASERRFEMRDKARKIMKINPLA